jgi:hypothetical protein
MTARRRIDGRLPDVKQIGPRPDQQQNGNGFWPLTEHSVCATCAALVPNTDRAHQRHRQWHEQIAGLEDGRAR